MFIDSASILPVVSHKNILYCPSFINHLSLYLCKFYLINGKFCFIDKGLVIL